MMVNIQNSKKNQQDMYSQNNGNVQLTREEPPSKLTEQEMYSQNNGNVQLKREEPPSKLTVKSNLVIS